MVQTEQYWVSNVRSVEGAEQSAVPLRDLRNVLLRARRARQAGLHVRPVFVLARVPLYLHHTWTFNGGDIRDMSLYEDVQSGQRGRGRGLDQITRVFETGRHII